MQVRVLFFATAREAAGCAAAELSVPEGASVEDARRALAERFPPLRDRLPQVRFALDREFVGLEAPLREGAELAVIPPVSGG
jgi:molybdopterin converting factor subunit 1